MIPKKTQKVIIFDASTLISFAMACLYDEFRELKKNFDGKFLITKEVKEEVIDKPMKIQRFQLEAIRLQQLIDEKILEMPESIGVATKQVSDRTKKLMELANDTFVGGKDKIKLIDLGESSCMALGQILNEKGVNNVLAIDERTLRNLCEAPESLKKFLEKKMHTKVYINRENLAAFKDFKIIRSVELVYIAYKKNLVGKKEKKLLEALIYALKFKGCAVSYEDIDEIKKLG